MKIKLSLIRLLVIPFIFALASCATMDTVTNAPANAGISRSFSGNYELVKDAVVTSLQILNINTKQFKEAPEGFTILFNKSISAFSWGEVGRILVSKVDENNTRVNVHSKKRHKLQITGTDEQEFADTLFQGVTKILDKRKK